MPSVDSQNPFEPPSEEKSSESPSTSSIPATVAVALAAGTLLVLIQVAETGYLLDRQESWYESLPRMSVVSGGLMIRPVVSGGLMVSLFLRSRVGWAAARLYFSFGVLTTLAFLVLAWTRLEGLLPVILGLIGLGLHLIILFGLSTELARRYYGLACPECDHVNAGGEDWLCFQRICHKCRHRW
ncbi:MAG: hypothetical protein WDZ51_10015 [Pirellulaceae bacterium]